jgi:hypothetical protein
MTAEYQLISPPVTEPVSLLEAKAWIKVDHSDEDALIQILIQTARERCESLTGLSLCLQQWAVYLDGWPMQSLEDWWDGFREGAFMNAPLQAIPLRHGPVRQIDAFNLYDESDTITVYSSTHYSLDRIRNRLVLQPNAPVPQGARILNPIEVIYTTGYEFNPASIKAGLLKLIAHLYEHRGDDGNRIPNSILALWQPYMKVRR